MPTDEGNGESPTATDNASSEQDAISPELVESHPLYQELKQKYSAAHQSMDQSNLTKKQLEAELARYKVLAGDEEPEPEEEKPSYVTQDELKSSLWETQHAKDLELYADDDYKKELDRGVPKDIALQYAKIRHQGNSGSAQVMRQQSMASQDSTSTRDLSDVEITDEDRADMAKWGYSEAALLKQKRLKKERG